MSIDKDFMAPPALILKILASEHHADVVELLTKLLAHVDFLRALVQALHQSQHLTVAADHLFELIGHLVVFKFHGLVDEPGLSVKCIKPVRMHGGKGRRLGRHLWWCKVLQLVFDFWLAWQPLTLCDDLLHEGALSNRTVEHLGQVFAQCGLLGAVVTPHDRLLHCHREIDE